MASPLEVYVLLKAGTCEVIKIHTCVKSKRGEISFGFPSEYFEALLCCKVSK